MTLIDQLLAVIIEVRVNHQRSGYSSFCLCGKEFSLHHEADMAAQAIAERLEQVGQLHHSKSTMVCMDKNCNVTEAEPVYRLRLEGEKP